MKTAIVTGASGQLGPIWCDVLQGLNYRPISFDLPDWDITKQKDIDEFFSHQRYSPEVIIMNAAIDTPPGTKNSTFHGDLEEIIKVNLMGHCRLVEAFLPSMIRTPTGGIIIGISSIQGFIGADWRNYKEGFEKPVGYNLSKAALNQYVRSLTVQYGRCGIRACNIGFGAYDGGRLDDDFLQKYLKSVPINRPVSEQSARAALTFALTCPEFAGQTLMVEGGYLSW